MTKQQTMDTLIGDELGLRPKMIRFYALRMIFEIARGKPLTNQEQRILFNKSSQSNMRKIFNEKTNCKANG